jgi:hypothetical protein
MVLDPLPSELVVPYVTEKVELSVTEVPDADGSYRPGLAATCVEPVSMRSVALEEPSVKLPNQKPDFRLRGREPEPLEEEEEESGAAETAAAADDAARMAAVARREEGEGMVGVGKEREGDRNGV